MAAHGLTLMRQCLKVAADGKPASTILRHVGWSLDAMGTCCSRSFPTDHWLAVWLASERVGRGETSVERDLLPALRDAAASVAWMDAYPSLEAVEAAMAAYVRPGKPYCTSRLRRFESGDAVAHGVARAAITGHFPIERRAPTI